MVEEVYFVEGVSKKDAIIGMDMFPTGPAKVTQKSRKAVLIKDEK